MMRIENAELNGSKKCIFSGERIRGKYAILLDEEQDLWLSYNNRQKFVSGILESRKGPTIEYKQHDRKLRVLDLFSGRKGWSTAMKDRGHYVLTIDNNPEMEPDICMNIMELTTEDIGTDWDIVLASPPCEAFSIASCMHHWSAELPRVPKTQFADDSLQLVQHTFDLIQEINPRYWAMENPRGMLRKVWKEPTLTTYFASWLGGVHETRRPQKPTDLWGKFPERMPWPEPRNWEIAKRGARTGTQGLARDEAAMIPYGLSFTLCIHAEEMKMRPNTEHKTHGTPNQRRQGTLDILLKFVDLFGNHPMIQV